MCYRPWPLQRRKSVSHASRARRHCRLVMSRAAVGLTGNKHGSLAVSFSEAAILQVVSNMFGEACKEMNDDVRDAVGEITNMICGDARRILAEHGHHFQAAIPTVIDGKGHKICHPLPGFVLVIPFTVGEEGKCFLEVCLTESDARQVRTPKTPRLPD